MSDSADGGTGRRSDSEHTTPAGVLVESLRPQHWSKNILVLFPAIAGHVALEPVTAVRLALGFVAFSFVASGVYLINDLVDLESDRRHPRKRHRPLPAGRVSLQQARAIMLALGVLAFFVTIPLPGEFTAVLVIYICLNVAYSLVLKRVVMLDVLSLVGFYILRLFAGAILVDVPLTGWFLAFFAFTLLSLAFAKRVAELQTTGDLVSANGRGYLPEDLATLRGFGVVCAVTGVLVYCLYITGEDVRVLYLQPELLWLGFPLLMYGMTRLWLHVGRGTMMDDPVEFMLRDPRTYFVVVGMVITVFAAKAGIPL